MKLKKGDYVNIEGVSEKVFDALVAVAKASGLVDMDVDRFFSEEYLIVSSDETIWTLEADDQFFKKEAINEITIEQWLFSLAPDWAVDIKLMDDGERIYSDGEGFSAPIYSTEKKTHHASLTSWEPIMKRSKPEPKKWEPKVGEDAKYGKAKVEVICIHKEDAWVKFSSGTLDTVLKKDLEPLPTPEEELIELLSKSFKESFSYEQMSKALIKAGYKK